MKRPLVLVIVSFILGIFFMNIKRTVFCTALLFCLLFLLFNYKCFKKYDTKYPILSKSIKKKKLAVIILAMLFALILGHVYANIDYKNKYRYILDIADKEVSLSGIIVENDDNEYLIKNAYINGNKVGGKIKIKSTNKYKVLDEFSSKVVLELPSLNMNFGGFNYREYLYSKNILAIGEELHFEDAKVKKLNLIESGSIKIREYISGIIDASYPKDEAQILKAILIGKSGNLEKDIKEFYQKAGIVHILVVSGAHIALIVASLKAMLDKLKISKQYYNFILITLIIIYVYVAGAGESVLRAGIVAVIALLAGICGRQNDSITTIFMSAFILAILNPMVIYSVGFQLSFAGALGIIILNKKIVKWFSFLPQIIAESVSVSLAAQIFIIPVTAYHFNSINLIGMIASLVVMPIINLIMPLGFVGILPFAKNILINVNYALISILTNDAKLFSLFDFFEITVATPKVAYIVIYYLIIITCVSCKHYKKQLVACLIVCFAIISFVININSNGLEINYIYVGHGDSIFIITPDKKTILIDTGDKYNYKDNTYDIAQKTVIPFVLDKGYKNIDLLILSHLDSDHAGGTETILESLNVKQILIGKNSVNSERFKEIEKVCDKEGTRMNLVAAGNGFYLGDVKFSVLSPFEELNETENNNSIVLLLEYKGTKALFMGDLESKGEDILLKKYDIDADILKVGHHGSITSTTEKFLNIVTPQIAIISVGERFASLPNKEVLERLKGSKVYITKEDGGIQVTINKNGIIKLKTALNNN